MRIKLVGGPMDNTTYSLIPGPNQRTLRPPDSMEFADWSGLQNRMAHRYFARHDRPIDPTDNDPTFELVYKYREQE